MRDRTPKGQRGAWSVPIAVMLCALLLCACGPIQPAPTPFMEQTAAPTTVSNDAEAPEPASVSASRNDQLAQDMFPSQPAASGAPPAATGQTAASSASASEPAQDEGPVRMRAVWIASVLHIDFPSEPGSPEQHQEEFRKILDNMADWGLDTAIVQVRPMADAFYKSEINPWSSYLTGTQGEDPGWDPLDFMIAEAHSRNISLHVWLNPYRVTHSSEHVTIEDLAEGSLAREHPEWLIEHESTLYFDPAREEIKQHIADTVKEIVDNYDVDGVHFDDYFYPAGYPLPEGAEPDGLIDRERRAHINDMLRRVKTVCDNAPHRVVFGVSPFGVWKNSTTDPAGSDTRANESYYAMAADSVRWIREGLIDYIAPQLYWPLGHELADYDTLAHWWARQTEGTDVSLIIGQGVYNDEVASEIMDELELNAEIPEITGSIFFSYSDLADNPEVADAVRAFYAGEPNSAAVSSVEQSSSAEVSAS